jgi:hypothetical protein
LPEVAVSEEPLIAVPPPTMKIITPDVPSEVPPADCRVPDAAAADEHIQVQIFTDELGQVVAALMALQTGVGLAHLIADNARNEEEEKPKVPPRDLSKE